MITYFDTSAFVPLLIEEPSSQYCRRLWDSADSVVTTRLLYVEAAAALAQARRKRRLTGRQQEAALWLLEEMWPEFEVVEVDDDVAGRAARLARLAALRGYDAVHCASAELVADKELVVACGDRQLLAACAKLGMMTADVTASPLD